MLQGQLVGCWFDFFTVEQHYVAFIQRDALEIMKEKLVAMNHLQVM